MPSSQTKGISSPIDPNKNKPPSNKDVTGRNAEEIKILKTLMYGLLYVLFAGFAGCFIAATSMLVDSFNNKAASYQQLSNKVFEQNTKIDKLEESINQSRTTPQPSSIKIRH